MGEHTFMSYSRQEYYFAESLTLHLQHRGLSVWFDVQQLEPGVNWKADIDDGLARSQSLTLVASRSSLASPYVEQEWRAALAMDKPIFVVCYERVRLPADLRSRATKVDLRGNFEAGVERLAGMLDGPAQARGDRLLWLPRLSGGVRRMALTLLLDDLQILATNILVFVLFVMALYPGSLVRLLLEALLDGVLDVSLLVDVLIALLGVLLVFRYLINFRHRFKAVFFLGRDFDYAVLVNSVAPEVDLRWPLVLMAVLGISYVLPSAPPFLRDMGVRWTLPYTYPLHVLVALLAVLVGVWIMNPLIRRFAPAHPNPDIVRWARLGAVSQSWRVATNSGVLKYEKAQLPSEAAIREANAIPAVIAAPAVNTPDMLDPKSYCVVYTPADEEVAQRIRQDFSNLGYTEISPAMHNIQILSYRTPLEMLRAWAQTGRGVIGVLVTDIRIVDEMQALTSFQLVDVRHQNWSQMSAFFRFLSSDEESSRARFSQEVMPVNLAATRKHGPLQTLAQYLFMLGLLIAIFVAYFFVRMAYFAIPLRPVAPAFVLPVAGCGALLLLALVLIGIGLGVLRGVRWLPVPLFIVALYTPLILMPLVDLGGNLFGEISAFSVSVALSLRQSLVIVGFYAVVCIPIVRALFQQPFLLVSRGDDVLGMPPLNIEWASMAKSLILLFAVVIYTLMSS